MSRYRDSSSPLQSSYSSPNLSTTLGPSSPWSGYSDSDSDPDSPFISSHALEADYLAQRAQAEAALDELLQSLDADAPVPHNSPASTSSSDDEDRGEPLRAPSVLRRTVIHEGIVLYEGFVPAEGPPKPPSTEPLVPVSLPKCVPRRHVTL